MESLIEAIKWEAIWLGWLELIEFEEIITFPFETERA